MNKRFLFSRNNEVRKVKVFTTKDLDGIVCGVIAKMAFFQDNLVDKNFYDNVDIEFCEQNNLDNILTFLCNPDANYKEFDSVFFVGIELTEEIGDFCNIILDTNAKIDFFALGTTTTLANLVDKTNDLGYTKYQFVHPGLIPNNPFSTNADIFRTYLTHKYYKNFKNQMLEQMLNIAFTEQCSTDFKNDEVKDINVLLEIKGYHGLVDDFYAKITNKIKTVTWKYEKNTSRLTDKSILSELDIKAITRKKKEIKEYIHDTITNQTMTFKLYLNKSIVTMAVVIASEHKERIYKQIFSKNRNVDLVYIIHPSYNKANIYKRRGPKGDSIKLDIKIKESSFESIPHENIDDYSIVDTKEFKLPNKFKRYIFESGLFDDYDIHISKKAFEKRTSDIANELLAKNNSKNPFEKAQLEESISNIV